MARQLAPAERIERFRRCCIEGRPIVVADAWAVLERLDGQTSRPVAGRLRLQQRDADLIALAEAICPGLPTRKAARRVSDLLQADEPHVPAEALPILRRAKAAGAPSERQVANIYSRRNRK